jgi:hypothetical protein
MVNKRVKLPPTARNVRPLTAEEQKALFDSLMKNPDFVAGLKQAREEKERGDPGVRLSDLKRGGV